MGRRCGLAPYAVSTSYCTVLIGLATEDTEVGNKQLHVDLVLWNMVSHSTHVQVTGTILALCL